VLRYFQVTTSDGYILSMQRIPEGRGKGSGSRTRKQPVIIQHGVLVVSGKLYNYPFLAHNIHNIISALNAH